MRKRQLFVISSALLCASLSGCSGSADEPAPIENAAEPETSAPENDSRPVATPSAVVTGPATANLAAEVPLDAPPAPDEQMMDDAAATGMTARTPREETTEDVAEVGVTANQN